MDDIDEFELNTNGAIGLNDESLLRSWRSYLVERELAPATITRYECELQRLRLWLDGRGDRGRNGLSGVSKETLLEYRRWLISSLSPSGANVAIAAVNSLWTSLGKTELKVKGPRVQARGLRPLDSNLAYAEYKRLVAAAESLDDPRASLAIQSLCAAGLRVSELPFLTVEAAGNGVMWVSNKGKIRQVVLPRELCAMLEDYCARVGLKEGPIFAGKAGKPIARTTIWRWMKAAAALAKIPDSKVYPHNLRHLFAARYYESYCDLDAVSDALGHSKLETTRIYIAATSVERRGQIESLDLVIHKQELRAP